MRGVSAGLVSTSQRSCCRIQAISSQTSMDSIVVGRKDGGTAPDRFWEEASDIFYQGLGKAKRAKLDDTIHLEDTIKSLQLTQSKVSNEDGTHTLRVASKDIDIKVGGVMRRLELMH